MPRLCMWHTTSSRVKECDITDGKDRKKKTKSLLSAEEIIQWSRSLEKLLATQSGQNAFREFLKSEYSEENIEFWLACEDYKKTQAGYLYGKAEKIYQEFVQSDAKKQINIDFHTKKSVTKKIQDPRPSSFDEAQRLVYVLMERDSYPRFLKSRLYYNLLSKVQGSPSNEN